MEPLLRIEEVAEILKLLPKTVRQYVREKKIKGVKIGREWRIKEDDLSVFVDSVQIDLRGELVLPDTKIYSLARDFARNQPDDACIKHELADHLGKRIARYVIDKAVLRASEDDGGYAAFLEAVNDVLGQEVYSAEEC